MGRTDKINGLSEATAMEKLRLSGPNRLPESKNKNIILMFLGQFCDPLIYILFFGACFSIFLKEYSDGLFIFSILTINSLIGCAQEYFAQKSVSSLKNMVKSTVIVIRGGMEKEIDSEELVVGDLVLVKSGSKVPADIVLLESENLEINESMLTGESAGVVKDAKYVQKENCQIQEKLNEVFAGTIVTRGFFRGVVKATGVGTEMGRIALKINQKTEVESPLALRMKEFSKVFSVIVVLAITIVAMAAIARGGDVKDVLLMSISLAVGAIPEALPITITIALAIGVINMAKKKVIVKNLAAVEALGSCTVIASDKTGTLTQNEMRLMNVWDIDCRDIGDCDSPAEKGIPELTLERNNYNKFSRKEQFILSSSLANEAGENGGRFFGDMVDIAFLKYVASQNYDFREISNKFERTKMLYYTSETKYSAAFVELGEFTLIFAKGAPETIFSMCRGNPEGSMDKKLRELSDDGMRVLAVALGRLDRKPNQNYGMADLVNLEFLALASLLDPLREEARVSIEKCLGAGIEVVMLTGDSVRTAYTIARNLGFVENISEVRSGEEVREALARGKAALDSLTPGTRVYSRVEPLQKLEIVQSYMRNGNFVAVTGDGINDAPALKNANVGVAMGKSGTDIARESADVILLDDNLASIVNGIEEGRIVYNNIRKLIFFVVSCNIPEVIVYLLAIILSLPAPFNATQLLWLNVATEGIQNIFLAFEREEGDEMVHGPRRPDEPIFDSTMLRRCLYSIAAMSLLFTMQYYFSLRVLGMTQLRASSLLMLLFVFMQNFQVFSSRSEKKSIFRQNPLGNKKLLFGVLAATSIHIAVSEIDVTSKILRIKPLRLGEILVVFAYAAIIVLVSELEKLFRSRKHNSRVMANPSFGSDSIRS
ncbi:MAG: cation-transporting P-type ATPase [Rickettsiales bacterium]|jgi:Ca2+-transporting ATPase|nr:cation-transporting P-type ATPase [Rickettsiales bacterium]